MAYGFDWTWDYLSIPDSDDWNLGSENFTMDFWINFNSVKNYSGILNQIQDKSRDRMLFFHRDNWAWSQFFSFAVEEDDIYLFSNTWDFAPTLWQWYHVALVRNNDTFTVYVDWTSIWSTTVDVSFKDLSGDLGIGDLYNEWTYSLNWYLDEIRISKWDARWQWEFTPPTSAY